ncbi:S-adenosyl-L-methionine-dependent methyltransferase [Mycena rebaudengoi]|nr:S-adenosyl-L-methionine-dependent methyltransferase [Mycena rebaudengoi]
MNMAQSNLEVYTLKTPQEVAEKERLDAVHTALKGYLGQKLCFAPIYNTSPSKILELGCGSGAWAIDAATDFPSASVLAVDICPTLAEMALPENLEFQLLDISKDWPFEDATFDVVHIRLVLAHLPDGEKALERAAKLVKPGGWLIVEDSDLRRMVETGGPIVSKVVGLWLQILQSRGADAEIARRMESIIQNSHMFSEIHSKIVAVPICKYDSGPDNLKGLGITFHSTVKKIVDDWAQRFSAEGITKDLAKQYKEEIDGHVAGVLADMHFVWARRHWQ